MTSLKTAPGVSDNIRDNVFVDKNGSGRTFLLTDFNSIEVEPSVTDEALIAAAKASYEAFEARASLDDGLKGIPGIIGEVWL